MQIADGWLKLDEYGNLVPLRNITPAEVLYINFARRKHKDDTESKVRFLHNLREVKRTNAVEKERLLRRYPLTDPRSRDIVVDKIFPGPAPAFPATFEEAGIKFTNTVPEEGKRLPYPCLGDQDPAIPEENLESVTEVEMPKPEPVAA